MIARAAVTAAAVLALAACASAERPRGRGPDIGQRGHPSEVVAAELAFARAAREKGTWTAFREFSTSDAVWPAPALTNVRKNLAGVADPAEPIVWGPDAVWVSCDGSFALSTGPATYPDGRRTRFATIWQRQRSGEYRWVIDQGFDLESGYQAPEMIGARVADCPPGAGLSRRGRPEVRRGEGWGSGRSNDGTLEWSTVIAADCRRTFTASMVQGGEMTEVFRREAPPPEVAQGQSAPSCPA